MISSKPVKEIAAIELKPVAAVNLNIKGAVDISRYVGPVKFPCRVDIDAAADTGLQIAPHAESVYEWACVPSGPEAQD